ncbi:hypothetical protein ACQQ2N_10425 [Dokdonella sp. MW10]|uniref:hypothetical protein n=1 Tax=Dokdonella sp. MW10 TaxID=2992926 RepID=UPI003F813EEC
MSHSHSFLSWPFDLAINTAVFTTRQAMEGLEPVREVYHDRDGDWQFLCGTSMATEDLKVVCLGCVIEADPTIGELSEMPPGWCATRHGPGGEWIQEPYADDEDED